jgi:diguanylate cyclase (GGDEF)-like protein
MVTCWFLLIPSISFAEDKIVLQLKWKHGFQFAGYYAAQELGYYKDAGLDVELRPAAPGVIPVEEVIQGRAQYGIGNSALLLDREKGKPVVVLGVVFQHSPSIFITREDGQITTVNDLAGKRVMIEPNALELFTYLKQAGISSEQIQIIDHNYDVNALIQGDVDALSAYSSSEPYVLNQKGISFKIFTPREAGIDFYGDNLFTSEEQIESRPQQVEAFRAASMKGWQYAMEHKDELINLILKKYGDGLDRRKLLFEARAMDSLLVNNLIEIGHMNPERWGRVVTAYKTLGQIHNDRVLDGFIYKPQSGLLDIIKANHIVLLKYLLGLLLLISFLIYRNYQLRQFNLKLEYIAHRDQLTGIYNRKRLDEALDHEIERFFRYGHSFSVIMIDIDHFKNVNDSYGHQVGDQVIIQIATVLNKQIRVTDTLGRWGGEEFMLICPETEPDDTLQLAEKLRKAIEEKIFATVGHQTASFGFASYRKEDKANDIVKRADDALYNAKERGRNRVVASVLNASG